MFKDKKMEKMMFAIGNIFRESGTAYNYVEDRVLERMLECEANAKRNNRIAK